MCDLISFMPVWFRVLMVVIILAGVGNVVYIVDHCGWQGLLLGNGANTAIFMGWCDK